MTTRNICVRVKLTLGLFPGDWDDDDHDVLVILVDNDGDGDNCVDERKFNVNEGKSDDDALK